jgi:hypothetical protein
MAKIYNNKLFAFSGYLDLWAKAYRASNSIAFLLNMPAFS